jgi:hypothetical protein
LVGVIENEYLAALQKLWPEELKKRKAIYEPLQQALVTVLLICHATHLVTIKHGTGFEQDPATAG